ncbi:hypothetical protein BHE74_00007501 [Ensete ventricosum]|uniref:Uncharacterized protein n=1 Tax=Ensete ventricosum TaxID=4639 RepID=A0A444CTZ2_ENSVE|nr:hypothetical protein B296_00000139 [Ensete ventricosum]RWV89318.1 hypothetical protein GW17_00048535 [Ensete ventricosum]RWW83943.1 hypothetical protein BHE74_00007501 [Ensete ventricosum]RZR87685.1 hypothetical protein BHM03_00015130 [Ensete ventricosum]
MDSDFRVPRELSELQKKRAQYHPELPPCLQVSSSSNGGVGSGDGGRGGESLVSWLLGEIRHRVMRGVSFFLRDALDGWPRDATSSLGFSLIRGFLSCFGD